MTKQIINIGTSANKGNGDPLRTAFNKVNENFTELYAVSGTSLSDLKEVIQDYSADMLVTGTHSGINVSYNDTTNKLNLTINIDGGNASTSF